MEPITHYPQPEQASRRGLSRREMLRIGGALGVGLAGTGLLTRFGLAAQSDTATPAATTGSSTAEIVSAANAFLDTLSADEQSAVLFDWSDTEQKQRWSNFPEGLFTRDGLMWGNITEEQQNAWLALMQVTLSTEGYERVVAEWTADDYLTDGGGGAAPQGNANTNDASTPSGNGGPQGGGGMNMSYGSQYYWVAIIGTPSETDPWQWQWGGHHVTVNATIQGDNLSLTPSFIGVQPATYTDDNGNTVRPLGDIDDEAFALINALDADQQSMAVLGDTYIDLVLGPGEDGKVLQAEGLAASEMTADQQSALLHLIGHYTGLANAAAAATRMAEITDGLDDTYFAWYGDTASGSASYFRVSGPKIVIEYSPQGMGGDAAEHIHGIYRDPTNDYGAAFTGITITS